MLQVFTHMSAAEAKRYYTADYSISDYPIRDWTVESRWDGKAAEILGLAGSVRAPEFGRLCDNRLPDGSGVLTPRTRARRRVGYDLVFGCPKSLSLLYAMTGDNRILGAFRHAVQETMVQIEASAQARVRRGGVSSDRPTGRLVWATFLHFTTRPVNGLPDPHLHAHAFVFNATLDPVENRWKALQFGGFAREAPFHEATFHAALAAKVLELGYPVAADGRFWRIEGVPRSLDEKFSRRSAEVQATADRLGVESPARKAELARQGRQEKSRNLSWPELHRAWDDRLTPKERSVFRETARAARPIEPPITAQRALELAHKECFERSGLVLENVLLESALRIGVGHVKLDELRAELPRLAILKRGGRDQLYFMDEARLRDEREVLAFVRDARGNSRPFSTNHSDVAGVKDADILRVLRSLMASTDGISIVKSKSDAREVSLKALRSLGHPVKVLHGMPGAIVHPPPGAEAFASPPPHVSVKRPVIWVDHSQRLGLPQLLNVFREAAEKNARVVLSVSPGRISPNSPLRLIRSRSGALIRGTEGAKQQFAERRDAARAWRRGRPGEAVRAMDRLGVVREVDALELPRSVADYYVASQRKSTLNWVVANSELLASQINRAVRDLLVRMKKLGRSRRFEQLEPVRMDDARKALAKGNVVIFSKPVKGFKPGVRYKVIGRDPLGRVLARHGLWVEALPLRHADRFSVYRPSSIELAKGDVIRITARGRTLTEPFHVDQLRSKRTRFRNTQIAEAFGLPRPPGPYRVEPGALHRIKGFTLGGHIELDNGWILPKDYAHITHGYARPETRDQEMKSGGPLCALLHARDGRGHRLEGLFTDNLKKLKAEASGREVDDVPTAPHRERAASRERETSRGFDIGR